MIEIKHRYTGATIFSADVDSLKKALEKAIKDGANLDGANLDGANLDGANLTRANLTRANLYGANLDGANLDGANLDGANLDGANLDGANLTRANLYGANLDGANLDGANLDGANLTRANLTRANLDGANLDGANLDGANLDGANLTRANLTRANLTRANLYGANLDGANLDDARHVPVGLDYLKPVRDDIVAVLDQAPGEVAGLLGKLYAGEIEGSLYEGACACLKGTIANLRGVHYEKLGIKLDPASPAERWFLRISKGSTPLTNASAAFAAVVIEKWMRDRVEVSV